MNLRDCRRILNVPPEAGLEEVKSAFRRRAFQLHPDLNPGKDAAHQFRELNEAYVLLTRELKADTSRNARNAGRRNGEDQGPKAGRAEAAGAYARQSRNGAGTDAGPQGTSTRQERATRTRSAGRGPFRYREEEVLGDLLKDPFARQVFEDIYRKIRTSQPARRPATVSRRSIRLDWGGRSFHLDLSRGLGRRVADWFRGQLDDEQTLSYPARLLIPGRVIRLDVAARFSKTRTIEVRLPADFLPGRPIRLRGLGRKLGPYQGDLYLRITAK